MLQTILLPLDGSQLAETVLPHALTCAKVMNSHLILVHVLQTAKYPDSDSHTVDPLDWRLRKMEALRYLEETAERFSRAGVKAEAVLLLGDSAERIVEFAQERNVELIMMSSHGASGLSGWNVSSVVQKVILTTHTSVMIIPAYHRPDVSFGDLRYRRVVAPLDGSQRAECVLPLLKMLAQAHEAETDLITIVARPQMLQRTPLSSEDAELADRVVARNRAAAEKYLSQVQSRMDNHVNTHVLVSDDVIESLYEFVGREEADLVVFSAHGSSGNGNRRYGSIVTSFIAYGSTPLLIVQDLPPQKIRKTEAELAAQKRSDNGMGVRNVVNAPAAG
ncbi:MAG TPA: universal stress protein [Candidatus Binatia bacterium]|nr:universal stress protein [Candidatus Binatia bacterium]